MAQGSTFRRIRTALLLAMAPLALAAPAHAASCDSAARVAVDLWDEYGMHAKQLGLRRLPAGE